jgi:hypothetical protein
VFKWQGSYGAFSVSPHEKQKVIRYILNQKEHHEGGTIWPSGEETTEFLDATHAIVDSRLDSRLDPVPAKAGT